jgi:hypothetical protein
MRWWRGSKRAQQLPRASPSGGVELHLFHPSGARATPPAPAPGAPPSIAVRRMSCRRSRPAARHVRVRRSRASNA